MHIKIIRSINKDLRYEDAKKEIFSDIDFLRELAEIERKKNYSETQNIESKRLSDIYLKEISAKYTNNSLFWSITESVVRKKIIGSFDNVFYNAENVRVINDLVKDNLITIVPNHRSVFDFMILPYILIKETTFMPIVLAADVFDQFIIGDIFRRMGAYFVRRKESDELYFLVFRYYVMLILKYELIHMVFIEGGRNKAGGYSEPKTGVLKYILEGEKKHNIKKDILFFPVNISYDYVAESNVVIDENVSGKRKHIFNSMIKYITKKNLGNCYINFGRPISLSSMHSNYDSESELAISLGNLLIENIKSLVIVSPISLLAYTLLESDKMSLKEFEEKFKENVKKLIDSGANVEHVNSEKITEYLEFADRKGLIIYDKSDEVILIGHKKRNVVVYYSNNIRHLF